MSRRLPAAAGWVVATLLCTAALAFPGEKERWVRVDSPHFTFFSSAGVKRTEKIARKLERLRQVLSRTSRGLDVASPTPTLIYVFKNDRGLEPYKLRPDGTPLNVAGYFVKTHDGNYVAIDAAVGLGAIYHEYLHSFLEENLPEIPLWLNEGLAEFYRTFESEGDGAEIGRHLDEHVLWLRQQGLMPLEEFFRVTTDSVDYNEGKRQGTYYAQAWALAHYLVAGDEVRRQLLGRYLDSLETAGDPVEAFFETFHTTLEDLQTALEAYVRQDRFDFYWFRFDESIDPGELESSPMPYAEVLYRLGDLLAHRAPLRVEDAKRHLDRALELNDGDARIWVTLAHLEDVQGRLDEAVPLYEKAIALDPENAHAYSRYGFSLLSRFSEAHAGETFLSTPPEILEARARFRKSLELRPDHPETLVGYGKTFYAEEGDVEEGIRALTRAVRLLPARTDVLVDLIVLLANSGRTEEARSLFGRTLRRLSQDPDGMALAEESILRADFRHAMDLAGEGETGQAIEILSHLDAGEKSGEIRSAVERALAELREIERRDGLVTRYNDAIAQAEAGRLDEAARLIEEVLASDPDEELRRIAEEALRRIRGGGDSR